MCLPVFLWPLSIASHHGQYGYKAALEWALEAGVVSYALSRPEDAVWEEGCAPQQEVRGCN